MAESFVQVAVDGAGKLLRTQTSTQGGNTVHEEVMVLADSVGNMVGTSGNVQNALQVSLYDSGATAFARGSAATVGTTQSPATQAATLQTTPPGNWSVVAFPATGSVAAAVKAAGTAGIKHVCTSVTFSLSEPATALAFQGNIQILDGATIIWQAAVSSGAGTALNGQMWHFTGLNLVGSAATSMTAQFSAGGGTATQEAVTIMGYDTV